jgi:hypothetical protein
LLRFFIFFLFIFSPNTLLEQVFAPWLGPWCPLIICSYIQQFHPWGPFFYFMISFKACLTRQIYIYMEMLKDDSSRKYSFCASCN